LKQAITGNILDFDQSNYFWRTIPYHIPANLFTISWKWIG